MRVMRAASVGVVGCRIRTAPKVVASLQAQTVWSPSGLGERPQLLDVLTRQLAREDEQCCALADFFAGWDTAPGTLA
ncbi:hypothetical protein [Streptomyces sp. NPDC059761]|uniref:hypothetical protein n=1 Tax=Streptomyces sp. NPDC059761 TaxID=3346937 RepID=UPI00366778EA